MSAFIALIVKDIKQLLRDPKTMIMVLMMPIIVLSLFVTGYGSESGSAPIAIVDLDKSTISWKLVDVFRTSGNFKITHYASTEEEGYNLVAKGVVYAAIIIPEGFGRKFVQGESVTVEIILDSSYSMVSDIVYQTLVAGLQRFQEELAEMHSKPVLQTVRKTVYGPKVTRIDNFFSVVMGILLHLVPMTLIGVSISKERERMTFEQLIMTPISSRDIVLSKLVAYSIMTISDMIVTFWVAVEFFNVNVKGKLPDLLILSALLLLDSLSIGLLISVISKNQLQAYQTATFFFIPSMLFSGFFMPTEYLSPQARNISKLLPLYYFLRAFRNIQLRGWTIYDNLWQVFILSVQTIFFLLLAIKLLRLKVD